MRPPGWKTVLLLLVFAALSAAPRAQPAKAPTIDQLLELKRAGSPAISPDGRFVAYTIRETDWEDDAYETQIWLADVKTGGMRQLTRGSKSSSSPAWSPDGRWLAFTSERSGRQQIYRIDPAGGEAEALTSGDEGVAGFTWAPDGASIAFAMIDPKPEAMKERDKKYGEFEIVDQDHRMTHLHVLDVATTTTRRLTEGAFTVGQFSWSPDGRAIAFDHRINADPASGGSADFSFVNVTGGAVRSLVNQDAPDTNPKWSPDGSRIAFETSMADPWYYFTNGYIATIPASGGAIDVLRTSPPPPLS